MSTDIGRIGAERRQSAPSRRFPALGSGASVVVCDGAMGTMLHSAGVPLDHSLCELNLSQPRLVRDLHRAYVAAGARMVQTNTFDANRLRLARMGLEDSVVEINIAGARLARHVAQDAADRVLVAGSVGPAVSAALVPRMPHSDRAPVLREQIAALADWVDLIMLETFGDIESLVQAVQVALAECDLPVIAQMTFGDDGQTLRGESPAEVASALASLELAAFGANCTVGPAMLQDVVPELARGHEVGVSVQPNAGMPRRLGRQLRYAHNVDYFAEAARQFVANGATIVGGCCGTTPAHIRAVANAVSLLEPSPRHQREPEPRAQEVISVGSWGADQPPAVSWPYAGEFVVVAGVHPPRGQDMPDFVAQATELSSAGVQLVAIAEREAPAARVNPVSGAIMLQERIGAEVIVQIDTADRSLSALQADLLGAHALGVSVILCRTGTPRAVGDYPESESQWDVDSIRLISTLAGLNSGVDWRGVPIPERTRFVIGAMIHTAAADRRLELDRAVEKIRAGAHFLLTDAIYDVGQAQHILSELRARGIDTPILGAVAPFDDAKTIARQTLERPEISIPAWSVSVPDQPLNAALDTARKLSDLLAGIFVHTPARFDAGVLDLVTALAQLRQEL
ncbi:bifunctional homocysteine S-methyltransferase/methylenetetrahydrofolate reductase [Streptomyces sp. NPDC005708]|uniref:bifunctional homocysteine S-methyltransferase/methylenetetrahydrofolate reductase n=1 Tax=Streptomyces sp. NPDC005708 TaxID=3154564 RepID=UPI0033C479BE